jgi:adenylyltransferase/sulfurtransferase
MPSIDLTTEEVTRYSRQLLLPEIGIDGQQRLKNAKVLIIGAGGLGSPLALYLAAAGVGTLGILDFDQVDLSNLQRQIAYSVKDIGRQKAESAGEFLKNINPLVKIITHNTALNSENALKIAENYHIIADCSDNFPTRYLVNDACVFLGKPEVYGSVLGLRGQASVFYAKKGPCYRCLYPEPPPQGPEPDCSTSGVLGVLPGIVGCIMANEVLKLIVGEQSALPKPLIGRLLLFNAWKTDFSELKIEKDENCPICGKNPSIKKLIDYGEFRGLGKNSKNTLCAELNPCLP